MPHFVTASLIGLLGFILNLPLGYWRASVKKYSKQWFLAVHLSVPVIYLLRVESGLSYQVIPFMILAAFSGQFVGAKVKGTTSGIHDSVN